MVSRAATTVTQYLAELPADRRAAVKGVRDIVKKNLPEGYREAMNWGMIAYEVPLARYPDTYNGQPLMYAAIASQKNYCALYLTNVYQDKELSARLKAAFKDAGKKLDMGKSCIHFHAADDLPLDMIGEIIRTTSVDEHIAKHEKNRKK